MATKLTDEQRQRIEDLYADGRKPSEIARELNLSGRQVSGYCRTITGDAFSSSRDDHRSSASGDRPQTPIGELVAGVKDLKELAEDPPAQASSPVDPAKTFEKGIEAAEKAQERAEERVGKGAPDQGGLYTLLETLITQQNASHSQAMERMEGSHELTLQRISAESEARLKAIDKESEARLKELEIKYEREEKEAERKRKDEKEHDREYWTRLETQRAEERKSLEKLKTEESKMMQEKIGVLTSNVNEQLKHAQEIIGEREESSKRSIEMQQNFSDQIAELKKSIGGDDQFKQVAEIFVDQIGKPIIEVVEKHVGGNNEPHTEDAQQSNKGDNGMGLLGDVGKRFAVGFKDGFLREVAPEIRKFGDQFSEWILKDMPITMALKQLFTWAEDPTYGKYVQAATSYIAMNSLDEILKAGAEFLNEKAMEVFASEKARDWYRRLQDAILVSFRAEDARMQERASSAKTQE